MTKERKTYRIKMTDTKRNIIQQLLQECDIEKAEDIHEALKDLFSGILNEMIKAEIDNHLGYPKNDLPIIQTCTVIIR